MSELQPRSSSSSAVATPLDPSREGMRFLVVVLMLVITGLFFHYSASSYRSMIEQSDPSAMWMKQLRGYGFGCLLFSLALLVKPRQWIDLFWMPVWLVVLFLLLATIATPLGRELNDAYRWLQLGIRFQPSELAKFSVPVATIALTGVYRYRSLLGWKLTARSAAVVALILVGLPTAIIFKQPDFGTCFFVLFLGVIPLFRWPKVPLFLVILLVPLSILLSPKVVSRWQEMEERFMAVYAPEKVDQVWSGLQAIGSGGLTGKGIGMGVSKTLHMPSEYSDFIFAVFAEETGFVGVLYLVTLYMLVLLFGWRLSRAVEDEDLSYLVRVVTLAITGQAVINLLVNVALFPTKGIQLPFFSHGSTGLAMFMGLTGVVVAISRTRVREVVATP